MSGYYDLQKFYRELETGVSFAKEEKKLYNSLRELNTGTPPSGFVFSPTLWANTGKITNPPIFGAVPPPVLAPPLAVPMPVPAPVVPAPVVPAPPAPAPVVPAPAPVVAPAPAPAPAPIRDLGEFIKVQGININAMPELTGLTQIKPYASADTGSVTNNGNMKFRKFDFVLRESKTRLNGVELQTVNDKNEQLVVPATNGLLLLIFATNKIQPDEFNVLWDRNKVSDDDKLAYLKLMRFTAVKGTPKPPGEIQKLIHSKLSPALQKYNLSYIQHHHDFITKQNTVTFRDPFGNELDANNIAELDRMNFNDQGQLIGAGLNKSKVLASAKNKAKTKALAKAKMRRLQLILGEIQAGNNNKKLLQELSILLK